MGLPVVSPLHWRELTGREEAFVEAYVGNPLPDGGVPPGALNATIAARKAGYAWPSRQGCRLASRPVVAWHVAVRIKIRYEVARNPDGSVRMKSGRR